MLAISELITASDIALALKLPKEKAWRYVARAEEQGGIRYSKRLSDPRANWFEAEAFAQWLEKQGFDTDAAVLREWLAQRNR